MALLLHSQTQSRIFIEKFHALVLCISYDRLFIISASLENNACDQFTNDSLVYLSNLRDNLFSLFAVDNIDYNPSSR